MAGPSPLSPRFPQLEGFTALPRSRGEPFSQDATMDIPLEKVVTHGSTTGTRQPSQSASTFGYDKNEKSGHFNPYIGRRRKQRSDTIGLGGGRLGDDEDKTTINQMGRIYYKILNFSIITRYFIYILPLGLLLAIPIIVGATAAPKARIGGVKIVWLFTWIEIVWLSLWGSKIVAHFLPKFFQFVIGVVSAGVRKYALVIRALEIPLSLVGWALVSFLTFTPLMLRNPDALSDPDPKARTLKDWQTVLRQLLAAALVCTLILLAERFLIQLISINYHRKQFDQRVKENKHQVFLLGLLYDASRSIFPSYCNEFAAEDYIIDDALNISSLKKKGESDKPSGTATPMRLLHNVGRFGDKAMSMFGNVASEITGKKVFQTNSAHNIVVEALERTRACEALARRLWMSFVVEGRDSLYQDDIMEVLGPDRRVEAEECFASLDRDGNGDISLDEMILTVTEIGRTRKSIANSMHDVDAAIKVLDGLLATVVFIIAIFIFVAFLNKSFTTTLATAGTALLSMSFVFAVTCQEVLGSCIFLFVKHPYDIGDRVDLSNDQLTVEKISLLYTVFKRVQNGRMVQIPNIVLNTLWIENVSRSKAMREQISIFANFDTSFDDVKALKAEMQAFVLDKENSRDFQPEIEVEVVGIAELNKLELRIEIRHKSNWSNEAVRANRRSKFMCALVLALRKVPIYAPGGGDAGLGSANQPSYSVAVSPDEAARAREEFAAKKEAKRLINQKKQAAEANPFTAEKPMATATGNDFATRDPMMSPIDLRDDVSSLHERPSMDSQSIEEVRGLLHRESTRGRRKQSETPLSPIAEPLTPRATYAPQPFAQYAPRPVVPGNAFAPTLSRTAGNAFAQQVPQQQGQSQSQAQAMARGGMGAQQTQAGRPAQPAPGVQTGVNPAVGAAMAVNGGVLGGVASGSGSGDGSGEGGD
ncbi:hypothetical protein EJ06DRAFT_484109 [Trichodelitschia bisporula]|uniref:EF-hand domain-containing protein n=1 Tax=Trichodelitschia bisporula TaxID=703511 RepID=A0A6G1HJW2_9PEZI|nr:hypothetical protein EJ06DRAFT_484109 [Trichodelitschia bisporula]